MFVECSVNSYLLIVNSVLIIGKIQIEQHMTTLSEAVTRLQLEPVAKRTDDPNPSRDEDRTLKFDVGEFTGTNDVDAYMDWEEALERYFEYKETSDALMTKMSKIRRMQMIKSKNPMQGS